MLDGSPFRFRGVDYRICGQLQGEAERFMLDLAAISGNGYTVVTLPSLAPGDIEKAVKSGLRFMLELDEPKLSGLVALPRPDRRRLMQDLTRGIRRAVQSWRGDHALIGVAIGADVPGGARAGAEIPHRILSELANTLHDEDPALLVGCRGAWPRLGDCPVEFDFLVVDYELRSLEALGPAIMASHREVGDRPLVIGDVSLRDHDRSSARDIRLVIDTALRCGAGGMILRTPTRDVCAEQSEAEKINHRTVRDLDVQWPSISVVVNAYNAAGTIDECLTHCERLEYPELELIVVDDGSTDATQEIVRSHSGARLIPIAHSGLSAGRNVGYQAAHGELVAYLDADAYPSPDWPWYIALGAIGERISGSGGPNVPPPDDPISARVVGRSPGGTMPQLSGPDRAEHLPGCNMAFWKRVLEQLHGFDPVIEGAEDIEFESRLLDSGGEIAYHPAALVWHHRRPGVGPYLRQQQHYGRGQAILERRYPDRFPAGRLRNALSRLRRRGQGAGGAHSYAVRYMTLPRQDGRLLELAHQWGVPPAVVLGSTAPLALVRRKLAAPALAATAFIATLFAIDVAVAGGARRRSERGLAFRARLAMLRLLRPLAFRWGHLSGRWQLRAAASEWPPTPDELAAPHAAPTRP